MDKDQDKGMNRREFIRKAAITGAVAWAVPAIQTVAATPAYAGQTSPAFCPHSTPGGSGSSCIGACFVKCASQGCTAGAGMRCQGPCQPGGAICSSGDTCCDAACDPANWNCFSGGSCLATATFSGC